MSGHFIKLEEDILRMFQWPAVCLQVVEFALALQIALWL